MEFPPNEIITDRNGYPADAKDCRYKVFFTVLDDGKVYFIHQCTSHGHGWAEFIEELP